RLPSASPVAIATQPAPASGDLPSADLAQGPPVAGSSLPHRCRQLDAGSPGVPRLPSCAPSAGPLLRARARAAPRAGSPEARLLLLPVLSVRDEPRRPSWHRPLSAG